ncbi:hypothetical protein SAMD00019534_038740 [Acytostelium subglobosum LB1]|uniref:hypothetical protein n=1 Tax=Acytostelium subglobosum LB1 TaxID=1410327 RepID=UPI000644BA79|nr:hypothetical protein SAMD00019534_038740 [Acytostelium subglobosum LB1]GAM20699.1 hypothetical protein SAMD00019534_038740 [Acytostelium subglobosum LB1]|eukprot:XP_012760220.1 hypothetical protein SAMD00019534_038740 [Acytostelium subglobosum LB1]
MSSLAALKALTEKKRKETELAKESKAGGDAGGGAPTKKYKTRGEIEKEAQKKKEEEKLAKQRELDEKKSKQDEEQRRQNGQSSGNGEQSTVTSLSNKSINSNSSESSEPEPFLPKNQVILRLRLRGHPITFFGETDYIRAERLRLLEENEPIEYGTQGENEFARYMKQIDNDLKSGDKSEDAKNKKKKSEVPEESEEQLKIEATKSKFGTIYYFLWKLLKEWEESIEMQPDEERMSRQGKEKFATFLQCSAHIKPLFDHLKAKTLPADILEHIHKIVQFCKEREYIRAHDQYLQMAIGNAPWPMGVTMVGIHERSSREKISSNQVAHVLNDETQRKYIQAVKRLTTFCQIKYPTNPSKCVG